MDTVVTAAKSLPTFYPKRTLQSLQLNTKYHILAMRNVKTRFGVSVVCDLEDVGACPQPPENRFYVFLPKRWDGLYEDEVLAGIQPCALSLTALSHTPLANDLVSVQIDIDYSVSITGTIN